MVCIDGIALEMVGESAQEELINDTGKTRVSNCPGHGFVGCCNSPSLLDSHVILNFTVTPVRQVFGVVIDRIESIASYKSDGIGQNGPRNGKGWRDTSTRNHRLLGILGDQAGIHFNEIRMLVAKTLRQFRFDLEAFQEQCVQMFQTISYGRVVADILECVMLFQAEKFPELVQGTKIPSPCLLHAEHRYCLQACGDVVWAKGAYKLNVSFDAKSFNCLGPPYLQCPRWKR